MLPQGRSGTAAGRRRQQCTGQRPCGAERRSRVRRQRRRGCCLSPMQEEPGGSRSPPADACASSIGALGVTAVDARSVRLPSRNHAATRPHRRRVMPAAVRTGAAKPRSATASRLSQARAHTQSSWASVKDSLGPLYSTKRAERRIGDRSKQQRRACRLP